MKWQAPAAASFVGVALYDTNAYQNLANSTNTAVTFNSERFDTDGFHSTTTNTSRITIPSGKGGKYLVTAQTAFDLNATGLREIKLYKNGAQVNRTFTSSAGYQLVTQTYIIDLVATDYIEMFVLQSSGGALDIYKGTTEQTFFQAVYLGA